MSSDMEYELSSRTDHKIDYQFHQIKNESFEKIYSKYQIKYIQGATRGTQSIKIIEAISKQFESQYQNINKNMYLGATELYVSKSRLVDLNKEARDVIPSNTYFMHVVGILIFSLEKRTGYIIFDPEMTLTRPAVVMEDGLKPYPEFNDNFEPNVVYKTLDNNKNYVVTSFFNTLLKLSDKQFPADTNYTQIIYVGRPYCSFLDTTDRYLLLEKNKYVWKRNENGDVVSGCTFEATNKIVTTAKKGKKIDTIFHLYYTKSSDTQNKELEHVHAKAEEFEYLTPETSEKQKAIETITKISEQMELKGSLQNTLSRVVSALKCKDFMVSLSAFNLTKFLSIVDEETATFCEKYLL